MIIRQAHLGNQRCCCLLWLPAPGRRAFDDDPSSNDDQGDRSFHTLVAIVATMCMRGLGGETIWLYYKNKWQITTETNNAGLARPSREAQTKNAEDMAERQTDPEHSLCTPPHESSLRTQVRNTVMPATKESSTSTRRAEQRKIMRVVAGRGSASARAFTPSRCLGHERALVAVQLPTLCRGPAQRTVPFPSDLP